jgi:hypothetical protein
MNWKECGRKRWWSNLRCYAGIFVEGLRKPDLLSEQQVSVPRFELGTSGMRSRTINHSTTTFFLRVK